ncbi:MAG: class B sortase [Lachnospiraceae bacterium]|nr:class B sortase [Lachnospiraceae bacterium]
MKDKKSGLSLLSVKTRIIIAIAAAILIFAIVLILYFLVTSLNDKGISNSLDTKYTKAGSFDNWYNLIDVDIAKLKLDNKDARGWIFFENVDISEPIVQGPDNTKYLETTFDGSNLLEGSIFLDAANQGDFSDKNSIIYGKNMPNGSMFGKLLKYKDEPEYYKDHQFFQVVTADRIYRYQVVAFNEVDKSSEVYKTSFANDREYVEFIRMVKSLSPVIIMIPDFSDPNATEDEFLIENYKKFATLSTDTGKEGTNYVVIGVYVGEYDRLDKSLVYDPYEV